MDLKNRKDGSFDFTENDSFLRGVYEASPLFTMVLSREDRHILAVSYNFERITGYEKEDVLGRRFDDLDLWTQGITETVLSKVGREKKTIYLPFRLKSGDELGCVFWIDAEDIAGRECLVIVGMEKPTTRDMQEIGVIATGKTRSELLGEHEARWRRMFDALHEGARGFIRSSFSESLVKEALKTLGEALSAARTYVFEYIPGPTETVFARWVWNAPGVIRLEPGHEIRLASFGPLADTWRRLFLERKALSIRVSDIPIGGAGGIFLGDSSVISVFPVFKGRDLWGFAGFDFLAGEESLTDLEKGGLAVFCDIFGAALLRKEADEKLDRSMNVLQRILDGIDAYVYVARMDTGEILFLNRSGKILFGDVAGRACWEVIHNSSGGPCPDCTNRWLLDSEGRPAGVYKWEFKSKKNDRWYQCLDSAVEWVDGSLVRVEIAFDITERKALVDRLRGTITTRDTFFSILSHDLRNPMSAFVGVTESLFENIGNFHPEELREAAKGLNGTAKRLLGLLEDLLSWSRMQRGSMPYHPRLIYPVALAESLRGVFKETAERKGLEILVEGVIDTAVLADYDMISAVLRNLVSNALKFSRFGGKVVVAVKDEGEKGVAVSVRDSGLGMDGDMIARLFRIDKLFTMPGTAGETGSGLGLILCREFLALHGSSLSVESAPGAGTVFTFYLTAALLPSQ